MVTQKILSCTTDFNIIIGLEQHVTLKTKVMAAENSALTITGINTFLIN